MVSTPSYDPNLLSGHDTADGPEELQRGSARRRRRADAQPGHPRETYPPGLDVQARHRRRRAGERQVHAGQPGRQRRRSSTCRRRRPPCRTRTAARAAERPGDADRRAARTPATPRSARSASTSGDDALREQAAEVRLRAGASRCRCAAPPATFPDDPNAPQTAQSAIGQYDVRATPLQMAMVAAAIANRGVAHEALPGAARCAAPTCRCSTTTKPQSLGTAMSPQIARRSSPTMMVDGRRRRHRHQRPDPRRPGGRQDRHRAAGRRPPPARVVHLVRAGRHDPQVAVAVIVENGGDAAEISGNGLAAPIAQRGHAGGARADDATRAPTVTARRPLPAASSGSPSAAWARCGAAQDECSAATSP